MQYALVNGVRSLASPRASAQCPICGAMVIAKCGSQVVHHWAHQRTANCDPWWENETSWHRDWKNQFPENTREITHIAPNGEIHRADIKTQNGLVVEIQHSHISEAERTSREKFYGNLVWIVDGKPFENNFEIYHPLPHPDSEIAKDIVWHKARRGLLGAQDGLFWRKSENPNYVNGDLVETYGIQSIRDELNRNYRGHHQFDWKKPRSTWLRSESPVFIDFGDDILGQIQNYGSSGLTCIQLFSKQAFVADTSSATHAEDILKRQFEPMI